VSSFVGNFYYLKRISCLNQPLKTYNDMKKTLTLLLLIISARTIAQKLDTLTVEKIMRDPKWIGVSPSNIRWGDDSKKVYFAWNPNNADRDKLFSITPTAIKPVKVSIGEQREIALQSGRWNKKHTLKLYEKNGDVYLSEPKTGKIQRLTNTADNESNPSFSADENKVIIYTRRKFILIKT